MLPNCDKSAAQRPYCGAFSVAAAKHLNVEVADFLPQSVAVKPQQIGCPDLISPGCCQGGRKQRIFDLAQNAVIEPGWRQAIFEPREISCEVALDRTAEIFVTPRLFASNRKCRLRQFRIDYRRGDCLLWVERGQPASQIFEFANITRPAMPLETLERRLINLFWRQTLSLRLREKVADEVGNVFSPLAKRRQAQGYDVEPEEQVLAEQALLDQKSKVFVRRRDDADVALDGCAATNRGVFALLEYAQQGGLRFHRHVADFIQKKRSTSRLFEATGTAGIGASESTLLVSEQFRFDQVSRDRRHIDGNKRACAPFPVVMQRARHQLLTCAGLAGDHYGQVGLHQARKDTVDFLHRRRSADQRDSFKLFAFRICRARSFPSRQRAADDADQFCQIERLRKILVGASLRGANSRHESILRTHDDDRQVGTRLANARDQVKCIFIRHDDVGDNQIAVALR